MANILAPSGLYRRIKPVVYGLAAIETVILVGLFIQTASSPPQASDSGGRAMALMFFILLPTVILAVAIALLVFGRRSMVATGLGMLIVATPVGGLIWWGVDEILINHSEAELAAGRGYFTGQDARALADAVVAHDLAKVTRLAKLTDVNQKGRWEMTFLKLALEKSSFDVAVVQVLLDAGADPNDDHAWPVGIAIYHGSAALLTQVLAAGGDSNVPDGLGAPIFFRAGQHPELIPQLLDSGARIEARTVNGRTMLLQSIDDEQWAAATLLLTRGADRTAIDRDGKGAADLLQEARRTIEANGRPVEPGLIALEAQLHDGR